MSFFAGDHLPPNGNGKLIVHVSIHYETFVLENAFGENDDCLNRGLVVRFQEDFNVGLKTITSHVDSQTSFQSRVRLGERPGFMEVVQDLSL